MFSFCWLPFEISRRNFTNSAYNKRSYICMDRLYYLTLSFFDLTHCYYLENLNMFPWRLAYLVEGSALHYHNWLSSLECIFVPLSIALCVDSFMCLVVQARALSGVLLTSHPCIDDGCVQRIVRPLKHALNKTYVHLIRWVSNDACVSPGISLARQKERIQLDESLTRRALEQAYARPVMCSTTHIFD